MRISSMEEYGLRCLLALARIGRDKQLSIADIARQEGLSVPYASKLLSILRRAHLVQAVRGRGGGFGIARDPGDINLLEVLTVLGGPILDPDHCNRFTGQNDSCVHADDCSVHEVLGSLAGYVEELLAGHTLEDLIRREETRQSSALPMARPAKQPTGASPLKTSNISIPRK